MLAGIGAALSLVVLPYLPALIIFNVADNLGSRRILARIALFPTGVLFIFLLSVYAISASPAFFISNSTKMDIIWGALVLYLGYIVIRKKSALIMRVAREMFPLWCLGTFLMGLLFGAVWVNYLSIHDLQASSIFESSLFTQNIWIELTDATFYATGLIVVLISASLIAFFLSNLAKGSLTRRRREVKLICGSIIIIFALYIISSDVWLLIRFGGLPF